ncbi:hypothetical protein M2459_002181 [Parabacteroides sp. PF5-5]|uniref:DUF3256 family protein n=1 Tax=unclassified Parabacteroides TaxID=2649774 RepID=UPI0024748146|nr:MULTISPECIES: DUF3256 family protein [unclassified Parabacteroides]MDH6305084.1 hypothetical protein [Parabacteroides sp. PH5-39]MDH6316434.1 hypothetical protein [Parabacteroides sp. PF5-13]MDH6319944.1 hypothetical protein [Parabacteroides sp. PH5-13]MDH6323823.1 hypothetical protein [Parabacteroides sp. PH5-8]MDH6327621.1 hypothetical protein [Parabacteroides sp. PH5-41]
MKRYISVLVFCFCVVGMWAQDMKSVFIAMPDVYIPQLESAWRKDLVDLYESGKEARLKNTMDGYSHLKQLTADYLLLQTTERSQVELKMLPLVNNTHIICMSITVEAPVADSRLQFFTTEWAPLEVSDLISPVAADWFLKEDADKNSDAYKDAIALLDMDLIRYELNPDNQTLTATYTTPLYLSKQEKGKVLPFLKDEPKIYTWEKFQFK